jgi:hypothetical protein
MRRVITVLLLVLACALAAICLRQPADRPSTSSPAPKTVADMPPASVPSSAPHSVTSSRSVTPRSTPESPARLIKHEGYYYSTTPCCSSTSCTKSKTGRCCSGTDCCECAWSLSAIQ